MISSETIHTISEIAQITLFLTTLIALVALFVTIRDINQKQNEKRILEWQRVVIFTIIANSEGPISFEDIRTKYFNDATEYGLDQIEGEKLRTLSIRAALIELLANKTIALLSADTYVVVRQFGFQDQLQLIAADRKKFFEDQSIVLTEIEQNNGKFTEGEWQSKIMNGAQYGAELKANILQILLFLRLNHCIQKDEDGKIRTLLPFERVREIHTVTNVTSGPSRTITPGPPKGPTFGGPKKEPATTPEG